MIDSAIGIILYWREQRKGVVEVITPDAYKKLDHTEQDTYERARVWCRPMTWGLHHSLDSGCDSFEKLGRILMDWDFCENDQRIPFSEEGVRELHPAIADHIIAKYDEIAYLGKTEQRKHVTSVFKYYNSGKATGVPTVPPPPAVVELNLIERFNWSFPQIAETPYRKIQELFLTMSQRDASEQGIKQVMESKEKLKAGKP